MAADYSQYTLQQLYDIYAKLDNEKDHSRAEALFGEIRKREKATVFTVDVKLATRGVRLLAFMIDTAIVWLISTFVIRFGYGSFFSLDLRRLFMGDSEYIKVLFFVVVASSCLIYLMVNGYYLYKSGQTVGKKLIGIKITDLKGNTPTLMKSYVLRFLIPSLVCSFPVLGMILWFIDVLFIFGKNKRCIHDYIAETKVMFAGDEIYW
jgi:uncharacterized RDD family membrane protein YckC